MKITTIKLGNIVGNCYLIKVDDGYILIDTGRKKLKKLEKALREVVNDISDIKLIILTHGDFDHSGNAAYFIKKYKIPVAMHRHDSEMVQTGDMFIGRTAPNMFIKYFVNYLFKIEVFNPTILLDEDYDLTQHGLNAKILNLPGHSKGSIGVLTCDGELFCGDLYTNTKKAMLNDIYDDEKLMNESHIRVQNLDVKHIYPGHGDRFESDDLLS